MSFTVSGSTEPHNSFRSRAAHYELDNIQSWEKYRDGLTRVLAMVLRPLVNSAEDSAPFDLGQAEEPAQALCELCQQGDEDEHVQSEPVQNAIHALARAIFDNHYGDDGKATRSPLMVATYLFALRPGKGEFHSPANTTFYTAALTWIGRVVAHEAVV